MSPDPVTPDTYRIGAAAKKLNVNRITVWRWVRDGKLPSFKIGSLTFIPAEALQPQIQPGCAEPEPYDAVRNNPVVGALRDAPLGNEKRPATGSNTVQRERPGFSRRVKGLEQRGAT